MSYAELFKRWQRQGILQEGRIYEEDAAKLNPYHLGPGPAGGQFTTRERDGQSNGLSPNSGKPIRGDRAQKPARQSYSVVPVKQTSGADNPKYIGDTNPKDVVLSDGSIVVDAQGNHIQMPGNVSLNDNIAFGESIKDLPSIITGPAIYDSPAKEITISAQFWPGGPMDYQRAYPTPAGDPNPLYVDFGNYNFGAVSAVAGYSLNTAQDAATIINDRNAFKPPFTASGSFWSGNPTNNAFITAGYNDYKMGRIKSSSQ